MVNRLYFYTITYSKSHYSSCSAAWKSALVGKLISTRASPSSVMDVFSSPPESKDLLQAFSCYPDHPRPALQSCSTASDYTQYFAKAFRKADNSPQTTVASTLKVRQKRLHPQIGKTKGCQMLASDSVTSRCCFTAVVWGRGKKEEKKRKTPDAYNLITKNN